MFGIGALGRGTRVLDPSAYGCGARASVRATSIYTYARMRATCVRRGDMRVHVDYMLYVI
jgi:hypothetical protein